MAGSSRLRVGAVPSRFQWIRVHVPAPRLSALERSNSRLGVDDRPPESEVVEDLSVCTMDHDYAARPLSCALENALQYIEEPEDRLQAMSVGSSNIFGRFCVSDETIRYYTRFPSQQVFEIFWESIAPSAKHLIFWTKAQRMGEEASATPSPARKIQLIDELFIYCLCVAAGLKEQVIADICGVSIATVSRIIITWANYLFFVLGSVPIWMSRQQVNDSMPQKCREYSPKVRVILDCTEVRCERAISLTLHSETFSNYKNTTTTFKGLLGVAPCGAVTFISSLFTGSTSDKEITRKSGILELLELDDEVMADKGFVTEEMLAAKGARPFKKGKQTRAVARLRILVERVIHRVKQNHIWDSTVPLSLAGSINQIWHNCCFMVNYQGPMFLESE
ncbi:uncharacterized protein LOC143528465 [Brachyhypopomus gauderio]|uniref:uncharacterized protein LOC143528465 n=1 Tax=Brachyhypopomus gauderio TaxID=698409 RepID=UPI0040432737